MQVSNEVWRLVNILGLSFGYHDSAACLVRDGRILAAVQEERFSRIKHDPSFPAQSARFCLEAGGLAGRGPDVVVFYEKPILKLDRVLETFLTVAPRGIRAFVRAMPNWLSERLRIETLLRRHLNWSGPLWFCAHHEAHAASAFFPSPFEEAAIVTLDGVGEWDTTTIGSGRGNRVEATRAIRFPHSLGLLYSAFTQFLGFRVNSDEYKVMGLAPYGEPRHVDRILSELVDLREDGSFRLRMDRFEFLAGSQTAGDAFARVFGCAPRRPEGPIEPIHMDIARSIQVVTEMAVLRIVQEAARRVNSRNLCLAGGVALNCVANGRVVREGPFEQVFIQPAASDAGGAVGAALWAWYQVLGNPRTPETPDGMQGALLGPAIRNEEVLAALDHFGLEGRFLDSDALHAEVARLLKDGRVVGVARGRMEFGPRALGNRSILADPRRADMQRRVNLKIKFRESFRPFAPAVLAERAAEWFDLDRQSPYMLLVSQVAQSRLRPLTREDAERRGLERLDVVRSEIPAVTHCDGSARVQTVDPRVHPDFHALLQGFERAAGCPVLLNTSLNLRGEPICATAMDACRTFLKSEMDALVLGSYLVERPATMREAPVPARIEPARRSFVRRLGRAWVRFARAVGRVNTTILLSLVFLTLVTPVALVRRLLRRDPLERRPDPATGSYWRDPDPGSRDPERMY